MVSLGGLNWVLLGIILLLLLLLLWFFYFFIPLGIIYGREFGRETALKGEGGRELSSSRARNPLALPLRTSATHAHAKFTKNRTSTVCPFIVIFCSPISYINILTDFVDAEIFLIDGDSLLLELLGEQTLDWSNGGQFLHLTYLLERFLQHFTNKG